MCVGAFTSHWTSWTDVPLAVHLSLSPPTTSHFLPLSLRLPRGPGPHLWSFIVTEHQSVTLCDGAAGP